MRNSAILFALTSALAACGGGGGGDAPATGNQAPGGVVATKVTLTPANYVAVAQESLSSSFYVADASTLVAGAETGDADVLMRFGQAQTGKLGGWFASTPALVTGAAVTSTEPCTNGGTLTIIDNDVNGNDRPDAGDTVSLTARNCAFEGSTLNGELSLVVNSFTGNPDTPPFSATVTLTFNNLNARSASTTSVGNGTMVLSLNARTASDQAVSVKATQFSTTSTYGNATYTRSLTNYTVSVDSTASSSRTTAAGDVSSSAFESKGVTIATTTPFTRVFPQKFPASGQATATGANGGVVRVTAISNTQVKIELDADANGSFETTVTKLWTELI